MNDLPFWYMSNPDVCEVTRLGHSTLAVKVKKGEFPPPDRIGSRSLWRSNLVAKWLTEQAARADAERAERTKLAEDKAQRMVQARRFKKSREDINPNVVFKAPPLKKKPHVAKRMAASPRHIEKSSHSDDQQGDGNATGAETEAVTPLRG